LGGNKYGVLAISNLGVVYGATYYGGTFNKGYVFRLVPASNGTGPWVGKAIYNFSGPDGANPLGGLRLDKYGVLWGTTSGGGANGEGTVFGMIP
jgi:hypothetical protein